MSGFVALRGFGGLTRKRSLVRSQCRPLRQTRFGQRVSFVHRIFTGCCQAATWGKRGARTLLAAPDKRCIFTVVSDLVMFLMFGVVGAAVAFAVCFFLFRALGRARGRREAVDFLTVRRGQ